MYTNAAYTESAPVGVQSALKVDRRAPAKFPDPQSGEEYADYILRLKDECPVFQVVIFGQNIPKYFMPADATLVQNVGKPQFPKLLVRKLTRSQVDAFIERARVTAIDVRNHKDYEDPDGKKRVADFFGYADQFLVIERLDAQKNFCVNIVEPPAEKPVGDGLTEQKRELYVEQVRRGEETEKKRKRDGSNG